MSDAFLDTPVGSMNFDPARGRPKDGPADATPAPKPSGTTTPPPASSGPGSYDLHGQPLWGTSGGMVYQYGRDSTGRDTYGPGTAEDGTPLGNQDGSMIGSQDPRYGAAQAALARYPGYTQVRVDQQGAVGGYLDPSQLIYDPTVGLITPIGNINQGHDDTGARMLGVVLGGPLLGVAGNAIAGAAGVVPEVAGPVADGTAGAAGAAGAAGPVGATGVETIPEVPGPDGTMLPPGSTPTGAFTPPPAEVTAAPPPVEGAPPPPPATYDPGAIADNLTPTINDSIPPYTPPPVESSPGFPVDTGPFSTPDFNIPPYSPPNVDVPLPDISIDNPWYAGPLDAVTSHPLQAAGLGMTAYNMINRPKPPTMPSTIPDANKPVIDQAISDIQHKGELSGDQRHNIDAQIDRHIREGTEALKQRAANSGMGANSMVTQQQINQFRENAEVVRGQMYQAQMQQNIGNAIQVWAEGNREDIAIQTAAANMAMENNREVAQLNQGIAQSLGWLYSMSNSRSAPSAPPRG